MKRCRHAAGIFANLGLAQSDDDNRRVLAVLAYLNSWRAGATGPVGPAAVA